MSMNILSQREIEVLKLIAHEYTMHQIASELYISLNTVSTHRRNIQRKLETANTAGMIRKSFELGLLQVNPLEKNTPNQYMAA